MPAPNFIPLAERLGGRKLRPRVDSTLKRNFLLPTRVRYYQCGAPVKHRCKCFTVSPVQNYFTGVLIFAVNGAFSYKT